VPDEKVSKPDAKVRPLGTKINGWWRFIAAVLAFAGLGSGGVAVYATKVEAGPVALIAAGLIFFLVAASGRLPSRLKYGDNEAAWEAAVEDLVIDVADGVSSQQTPRLLSSLAELAEVAPAAAAAGISTLSRAKAYEDIVIGMLLDAARQLGTTVTRIAISEHPEILGRTGFDFEIAYGNRLVFADIKYRIKPMNASTVTEAWGRAGIASYLAKSTQAAPIRVEVLLITNKPLSRQARELADSAQGDAGHEGLRYVVVSDPDDMSQLVQALRASLGIDT
jgi:hypothetical protein